MKIQELLESVDATGKNGLHPDAESTLPNAHFYPDLDNSSGYKAYRYGVAMAGMPDHPMDIAGPTGLKTVTIGYSDADDIIIDSTSKLFGAQKVRLTSKRSSEPRDTGAQSPVSSWNSKDKTAKKD
jgi:hypothetical protein